MFGQIQETFVMRENEETEYYTLSPSSSPLPSPKTKRSQKRKSQSSANFTLEDQSDDEGLSFSALARTKS